MGDLLNEIKQEKITTGKKSRIVEIAESMSASDKKDMYAALDDPAVSASKISRVMARRGHKLSIQIIYRYRNAKEDSAK